MIALVTAGVTSVIGVEALQTPGHRFQTVAGYVREEPGYEVGAARSGFTDLATKSVATRAGVRKPSAA